VIDPRTDLAEFTFLSKYARYIPELKRRETYEEACRRVMAMHRKHVGDKIPADTLDFVEQMLIERKILGAQRNMQFAGSAIERINLRGYNCSFSFFDRIAFLPEAVWLLLCGCGVGFSVQRHHVAKLPRLVRPAGRYPVLHVVADSIEGWAEAFRALLNSYVDGSGKVDFDFSQVRPEGAPISTSSAKAPGPAPLAASLESCRKVLNEVVRRGGKIRPIDAYDLTMHAVSCVRAGGVRRSATIALFSPDDTEMAQAKTGEWYKDNPQRRLSNNSGVLVRATADRAEFDALLGATQAYGDPGFYFVNSTEHGANPCQPASALLLTRKGLRRMGDIGVGDEVWSAEGWTVVEKKWSTGQKPVFKYKTTAGYFLGTENHRVVEGGVKVEVGQAAGIDILPGPVNLIDRTHTRAVVDGLMCGDGSWHEASNKAYLHVGKDDREDYVEWFSRNEECLEQCGISKDTSFLVNTSMTKDDLPLLPVRDVPERYLTAPPSVVASFLKGLYSANGTVLTKAKRVVLKTASPKMRDSVQSMLSSLGIRSYYTTNKKHDVEFANGTYECKESYDICITTDADVFAAKVGFLHLRKRVALGEVLDNKSLGGKAKATYPIVEVESLGVEEVFDITVGNKSHTYWTAGLNVSNCVEAGLDPVDHDTGETGWSFCNLTSTNIASCETPDDFYRCCTASAALGTIQASYMDTGYLPVVSRRIMERDALLGVSITGMADNPKLAFDPEVLSCGAEIVKMTNHTIAEMLGIAPAARATCVKPEGTGSLVLQVGSGITPHKARRYLRYAEGGKRTDPLIQHLMKYIPDAVVTSAYDPSGEEVKVVFPIDLGEGDLWLQEDVTAVDHLAAVKLVQENWVLPGTDRGDLSHNVSNTIVVQPHEWGDVGDFIWDNRQSFSGVALLANFGDYDHPQAPFVRVPNDDEVNVDPRALDAKALWLKLRAAWKTVDWSSLVEDEDRSAGIEVMACAGGACLI
jgi:hypothetical protein